MTNYDEKPWIKMPLTELTTPTPGRLCMGPRHWAITEDSCVLFYKHYSSPQCNTHQAIAQRVRPDCKTIYVEMAFVPHNCSDYN